MACTQQFVRCVCARMFNRTLWQGLCTLRMAHARCHMRVSMYDSNYMYQHIFDCIICISLYLDVINVICMQCSDDLHRTLWVRASQAKIILLKASLEN